MRTFLQRSLALALALCCLPACGAFDFHGQDLALRHDESADTIDLKLHYKSVSAPKVIRHKTNTETGEKTGGMDYICELIESIAAGKRYFMLVDNFFAFDLDKFESELNDDPSPETDAILAMIQTISVEHATVSLDSRGRISIDQHLRLRGASSAMALLNRSLHQNLLKDHASGSFDKGSASFFDEQTRAAFVAEARAGRAWISWTGSDLVLDLPMTPQSGARMLVEVVREQAKVTEPHMQDYLAQFFGLMGSVELKDNRLRMVTKAGEGGDLTLELEEDPREYNQTLLEALRARDFTFSDQ
ncbi:MAG: hypothetical protein ACI8QC_001979 [Planctomycetota bacterium]|jgi:hypothetical protein